VVDVSFREHLLRQEALARLGDADPEELADVVVSRDHPDHELACEVLLERFRPVMAKVAHRICQQLGHYGGRCPGSRCEHAFASAMSEFATRLTGDRYSFAAIGSHATSDFFRNANDRARRTASPTSVVSRWRAKHGADPSKVLGTAVTTELRATGRATDVRRRWNVDRGLLSRANVPAKHKAEAQKQLTDRSREHDPEIRKLIATSSPVHDVQKWANRLYDDACDNAPPGVTDHDDHRVARSVGWELVDDETTHAMRQAITLVIEILSKIDDGNFWQRHMGAAYHQTRVGVREYDDNYQSEFDTKRKRR